jgi:hypothetical protein
MTLTQLVEHYYYIAESLGLPPIVLFGVLAFFGFIFIFGLMVLIKIRRIRCSLLQLNDNLGALHRRIEQVIEIETTEKIDIKNDGPHSKIVIPKPASNGSGMAESNRAELLSEIVNSNQHRAEISEALIDRQEALFDHAKTESDLKGHILILLKKINKPVSYTEIVKQLSRECPDCNFDSILKELDQLQGNGEILSQIFSGKLYFQINKNRSKK